MEQESLYQDLYLEMVQATTDVPHRAIGPMVDTFRGAIEEVGAAIALRALAYAQRKSKIRDVKQAIVVACMQSRNPTARSMAKASLLGSDVYSTNVYCSGLPPYMVHRVFEYMRRPWMIVDHSGNEVERFRTKRQADHNIKSVANRVMTKTMGPKWRPDSTDYVSHLQLRVVKQDDFNKATRFVRGLVADWLRYLQSDQGLWMSVDMKDRNGLHRLYTDKSFTPRGWGLSDWPKGHPLHVPNWVREAVFEGKYPEGGLRDVLTQIRESSSNKEKLELVEKHKIPLRILSSVLDDSPESLIILLQAASPNEAIIMRSRLEDAGLFNNPDILRVWENKVKRSKRVAQADRVSAKGENEVANKIIADAQDEALKQTPINGNLLLCVDISSSMHEAIKITRVVVPMIIGAATGEVHAEFFNGYSFPVDFTGMSLSKARKVLSDYGPGGSTNMGAAVTSGFRLMKSPPDRVIYISDMANVSGRGPAHALEAVGFEGEVILVECGNVDVTTRESLIGPYSVTTLAAGNDTQLVAEQLVSLLSGSFVSLGQKIAETTIPQVVV